jgi:hypothetical protein
MNKTFFAPVIISMTPLTAAAVTSWTAEPSEFDRAVDPPSGRTETDKARVLRHPLVLPIERLNNIMKAFFATLIVAIVMLLAAGVSTSWGDSSRVDYRDTIAPTCWYMKHVLPGVTTAHRPATSNVLCTSDLRRKSQECETACQFASR